LPLHAQIFQTATAPCSEILTGIALQFSHPTIFAVTQMLFLSGVFKFAVAKTVRSDVIDVDELGGCDTRWEAQKVGSAEGAVYFV